MRGVFDTVTIEVVACNQVDLFHRYTQRFKRVYGVRRRSRGLIESSGNMRHDSTSWVRNCKVA
jgi:hypothetical protein